MSLWYSELYVAEADWIAQSAIHLGSGEAAASSETDMRLVRDHGGSYFIPAASIAGASRNFLAARASSQADYERGISHEPDAVRLLFGTSETFASLLSFDDALAESGQAITPRVRDGVRIDPRSGTAFANEEGGAKYDCEVLPAGTRFHLAIQLRVPRQDIFRGPVPAGYSDILPFFRCFLEAFTAGEIRLGARTRRGYGMGSIEGWTIRKCRMTEPDHFMAWLRRDKAAGSAMSLGDLPAMQRRDTRRRFSIYVSLQLVTSMMVRSGGNAEGDPDSVHLTEMDQSILPGTSLAGVLRHRCSRIARTMGVPDTDALVQGMFGPHHEQGSEAALRASRVWVDEAKLHDGSLQVQTRVAIDRFTQGSLEEKLFEEAPFWPSASSDGHIRNLRIALDAPRTDESGEHRFENEIGLLMMAFKDLWLGDLTVGGEAGAGRGVLRGIHARFEHPAFAGPLTLTASDPDDPSLVDRGGAAEDWSTLEGAARSWWAGQEAPVQ